MDEKLQELRNAAVESLIERKNDLTKQVERSADEATRLANALRAQGFKMAADDFDDAAYKLEKIRCDLDDVGNAGFAD